MTLLSDAMILARKDLLVEIRARQAMASAVALAGIALVVVGLVVGPDPGRLRALAPALVWTALLYAAIAVAERLERIDRSDDAFSGLWLVLADRRSMYVGRVLSLSTVLGLLQLAIWLTAVPLLDLQLRPEAIALILVLVADAAHGPLLLPVALLPLLVPTFLAGVQASSAVLDGQLGDATGWVAALLIEAALFAGLGLLTYETAASPN